VTASTTTIEAAVLPSSRHVPVTIGVSVGALVVVMLLLVLVITVGVVFARYKRKTCKHQEEIGMMKLTTQNQYLVHQ